MGTLFHARPSQMGISVSYDFGTSWQRLPKPRPPNTCFASQCILSISSDPWLTATGSTLLDVQLAQIVPGPVSETTPGTFTAEEINGIVVAKFTHSGGVLAFDKFVIVHAYNPGIIADKTSIDARGNDVLIAHVAIPDFSPRSVRISYSPDAGETWPMIPLVTIPASMVGGQAPWNPIIKVISATQAYLFVQGQLSPGMLPGVFSHHVFRLSRPNPLMAWTAQSIFEEMREHTPLYAGATDVSSTVRTFRNIVVADFDVVRDEFAGFYPEGSPIFKHHLWLALSTKVLGLDRPPAVQVFDILDRFGDPPPAASDWTFRHFGDLNFALPPVIDVDTDGQADQIFPDIAVAPGGSQIRAMWYRYGGNDTSGQPLDPRVMTAEGVRSFDNGQTWDFWPITLSTEDQNGQIPSPNDPIVGPARRRLCPIRGTIGDYSASVILPNAIFGRPTAISAFAYSRFVCDKVYLVSDIHVEAARW